MKSIFYLTAMALLVVAAGGCVAGTGLSEYSDPSFSVKYPHGWNATSGPYFSAVFTGPAENGSGPTLTVSLPSEGTIEAAAQSARSVQSRLLAYNVVSEENITLNGKTAFRRVYSWTDAAHNVPLTQIQVWVSSSGSFYTITATTTAETFQKYEPTFSQMISSFSIR